MSVLVWLNIVWPEESESGGQWNISGWKSGSANHPPYKSPNRASSSVKCGAEASFWREERREGGSLQNIGKLRLLLLLVDFEMWRLTADFCAAAPSFYANALWRLLPDPIALLQTQKRTILWWRLVSLMTKFGKSAQGCRFITEILHALKILLKWECVHTATAKMRPVPAKVDEFFEKLQTAFKPPPPPPAAASFSEKYIVNCSGNS